VAEQAGLGGASEPKPATNDYIPLCLDAVAQVRHCLGAAVNNGGTLRPSDNANKYAPREGYHQNLLWARNRLVGAEVIVRGAAFVQFAVHKDQHLECHRAHGGGVYGKLGYVQPASAVHRASSSATSCRNFGAPELFSAAVPKIRLSLVVCCLLPLQHWQGDHVRRTILSPAPT